MVVRMRVTRAHRDNRRSHHALKEPRLSKCSNCGAYHLRHRMCSECGYYRGRLIVDMVAKMEKKLQKRADTLPESNDSSDIKESKKDTSSGDESINDKADKTKKDSSDNGSDKDEKKD